MHDNRHLVEARLRRALKERIRPAVHPLSTPCRIEVWHVPGEPVPFTEAAAATFSEVAAGEPWGPAWSTSWFRISGQVPQEWAGRRVEAVIDLSFNERQPGFQSEALAWSPDGVPIKGVAPRSRYVPVDGPDVLFYLEAAANPVVLGPDGFVPTAKGARGVASGAPLYRIDAADLAVLDENVWALVQDIEVLDGLMHRLSEHEPRRHEILRALGRALDRLDLHNVPATAAQARKELADVLARPAHASAHRISAVGHAHIDSAWLWPLRETKRKVSRTVSSMLTLMDDHPDFVFAFSQVQQLVWIKEHYPAIFDRLREKVAAGQFVPTGGQWVEPDGNLPGGEAMARQFVYGKRFLIEELGVDPQTVWLPDTFGYSGALPQLIKLAGSRWFLTQKISWNQVNKFPHHTFRWEGIDGTRVFTHFPPAETYNSELSADELAHAVKNFADHGGATRSLLPFGWGDGGGGATREMLARAARTADLEGSPRVRIEGPDEFFRAAEAEYPDAPVWSGELYLELHRGTLTSQAATKRGNRRSEHLLREAELWSTTAAIHAGLAYPYDELERIWKTVLLHQFHDILPGTSIAWVHREAEQTYAEVAAELESLIDRALRALAGDGTQPMVFNAAPHPRAGAPALGAAPATGSLGFTPPTPAGDGFVLDNGVLRVTVDGRGLLVSLVDLAADREVIAPGAAGNLLQLHVDQPNLWDAWDVDTFYRNTVIDLVSADEVSGDGAAVRVVRSFGASTITQILRLDGRRLEIETDADWHENEKFLKAAFPLDVHADRSAAEIQFGHVQRPTHTNTSWDDARFETYQHRWVHVGEPGYGVALVNDSTYGYDATRDTRPGGGTTTTVRLSLLRAPNFPDPDCDRGRHQFRYAIVPGAAIGDAVREGYRANLPVRTVTGGTAPAPVIAVDNPAVVVEAVKLAEDRSGDVVVRLYESGGGRASATLTTGFALAGAHEVDLLERPLDTGAVDGTRLRLRPFQVVTVRLARRPAALAVTG